MTMAEAVARLVDLSNQWQVGIDLGSLLNGLDVSELAKVTCWDLAGKPDQVRSPGGTYRVQFPDGSRIIVLDIQGNYLEEPEVIIGDEANDYWDDDVDAEILVSND